MNLAILLLKYNIYFTMLHIKYNNLHYLKKLLSIEAGHHALTIQRS